MFARSTRELAESSAESAEPSAELANSSADSVIVDLPFLNMLNILKLMGISCQELANYCRLSTANRPSGYRPSVQHVM